MTTLQPTFNVFAYGSLMFHEVMHELLGKPCQGQPATLKGWSRHALRDRAYPGAIASDTANSEITGVIWCHLNAQDIAVLDQFEGDEYNKAQVDVLLQNGTTENAIIYVWKDLESLLGPWDVARFEQQHRATFVQQHRGQSTP